MNNLPFDATLIRRMIFDCHNHKNKDYDTLFFNKRDYTWVLAQYVNNTEIYIPLLNFIEVDTLTKSDFIRILPFCEKAIYFKLLFHGIHLSGLTDVGYLKLTHSPFNKEY